MTRSRRESNLGRSFGEPNSQSPVITHVLQYFRNVAALIDVCKGAPLFTSRLPFYSTAYAPCLREHDIDLGISLLHELEGEDSVTVLDIGIFFDWTTTADVDIGIGG